MLQDGLQALLSAVEDFEFVKDPPAARVNDRTGHVDVYIVDADSMGAGWVERMRQVTAYHDRPGPRVLVLAGSVEDVEPAEVAEVTAGCLLKSEATSDLIAAVRAVAAGEGWLSPPFARRFLELYRARPAASPAPRAPEIDRLSGRELSVLRLLARGSSNAEIARSLVLGESTIKTHVSRILAKLELRDRVQLAAFAHRNGLT
jgi:DNA-binding NarL/FixJ family response regulator